MISRFELFVKNTVTVISNFKVNRNVSISLYVWLVRTRSDYLCIVDMGRQPGQKLGRVEQIR